MARDPNTGWQGGRDRGLAGKLKQKAAEVAAAEDVALAALADALVARMRQAVPRRSGRLAASIRKTKVPAGYRLDAGGAATTKQVRAGSGKPYDYALGVEFGTAPHEVGGKFAGAESPGTRPEPFFFSSYRAMKTQIKTGLRDAANKAVKA